MTDPVEIAQTAQHQARLQELVANVKAHRDRIEALHEELLHAEVDGVYRFWHKSFKVYLRLQPGIRGTFAELEALAPHGTEIDSWLARIILDGLKPKWTEETNANWLAETRPIVEAYWHCKHIVERIIEFSDWDPSASNLLPSGVATVLTIYGLR